MSDTSVNISCLLHLLTTHLLYRFRMLPSSGGRERREKEGGGREEEEEGRREEKDREWSVILPSLIPRSCPASVARKSGRGWFIM